VQVLGLERRNALACSRFRCLPFQVAMDAKKSSTADEREYTQIKQKIRIAAKSAKNRLIDGILGVLFFAFLVFFCGYYWLPVLSLWPWQTPPICVLRAGPHFGHFTSASASRNQSVPSIRPGVSILTC